MFKLALGSLVAAAIGIHSVGFLTEADENIFVSRVTLEENCDLDINAFAVANLTTGDVRSFRYGRPLFEQKSLTGSK